MIYGKILQDSVPGFIRYIRPSAGLIFDGAAVAMARACLKIHFRIIITARQEDCNVRKILV